MTTPNESPSRCRFRLVWIIAAIAASSQPVAGARLAAEDSIPERAAMRTRVYVGMWSTHLRDINRGLNNNSLFGVAFRGFYAATFINSFGDRALSAGIQRSFTPGADAALTAALGYRAGILTGYDERFFGIGHLSPVIPFLQLVGSVDYRNLGVELAYAGVVATVTVNLRL